MNKLLVLLVLLSGCCNRTVNIDSISIDTVLYLADKCNTESVNRANMNSDFDYCLKGMKDQEWCSRVAVDLTYADSYKCLGRALESWRNR